MGRSILAPLSEGELLDIRNEYAHLSERELLDLNRKRTFQLSLLILPLAVMGVLLAFYSVRNFGSPEWYLQDIAVLQGFFAVASFVATVALIFGVRQCRAEDAASEKEYQEAVDSREKVE